MEVTPLPTLVSACGLSLKGDLDFFFLMVFSLFAMVRSLYAGATRANPSFNLRFIPAPRRPKLDAPGRAAGVAESQPMPVTYARFSRGGLAIDEPSPGRRRYIRCATRPGDTLASSVYMGVAHATSVNE
jgi:hypothetical protein